MTTSIGQQAISTAEHCREPGAGSAWGDPGLNDVYGYESRSDIATDSMLLLGQGITYGPVVYNGGWTSGSGYYVKGWSDPFLGDVTCDSGGLSGEVCGARVNATDTFIDGTGPGYTSPMTPEPMTTAAPAKVTAAVPTTTSAPVASSPQAKSSPA